MIDPTERERAFSQGLAGRSDFGACFNLPFSLVAYFSTAKSAMFRRVRSAVQGSLLLLFVLAGSGQTKEVAGTFAPLPQDSGSAGLQLMLRRLSTTARLMHTTAHPDDEDGGNDDAGVARQR